MASIHSNHKDDTCGVMHEDLEKIHWEDVDTEPCQPEEADYKPKRGKKGKYLKDWEYG